MTAQPHHLEYVQDVMPITTPRVIPFLDNLTALLDAGESAHEIANRLGMKADSVRRELAGDRHNRPDLLARFAGAERRLTLIPTQGGTRARVTVDEAPAGDCATVGDPDLWFDHDSRDDAARICWGCPLRVECLEGAKDRHEAYGMWGGEWFG